LRLAAGGHGLIDHQAAMQVNGRELGYLLFLAGSQQQTGGYQRH
jgi:hypothetical protein